jgi:hypothetical protein
MQKLNPYYQIYLTPSGSRTGRLLIAMNQKFKRIYLASPYSHPSEGVRNWRFKQVTELAAYLFMQHDYVFLLPITQGHLLAQIGNIESDFARWETQSLGMLAACDEMWVAKLEGWKDSKGVKAEIKYAKKNKIPIKYIDPSKYFKAKS